MQLRYKWGNESVQLRVVRIICSQCNTVIEQRIYFNKDRRYGMIVNFQLSIIPVYQKEKKIVVIPKNLEKKLLVLGESGWIYFGDKRIWVEKGTPLLVYVGKELEMTVFKTKLIVTDVESLIAVMFCGEYVYQWSGDDQYVYDVVDSELQSICEMCRRDA